MTLKNSSFKNNCAFTFFLCIFSTTHVLSQTQSSFENLGTWGTTYPILEKDAIASLKERVESMQKNGEIDAMHQQWAEKTRERVENGPPPVLGLTRAKQDRVWMFDPSVITDTNVSDKQGNLLVRAGTKINPLHVNKLRYEYLIIDGTSSEQIRWAVREYEKKESPLRIILVSGSPTKLMREYPEIQFFFDQYGRIVKRFGLSAIPVRIKQDGDKVKISEFGKLL